MDWIPSQIYWWSLEAKDFARTPYRIMPGRAHHLAESAERQRLYERRYAEWGGPVPPLSIFLEDGEAT